MVSCIAIIKNRISQNTLFLFWQNKASPSTDRFRMTKMTQPFSSELFNISLNYSRLSSYTCSIYIRFSVTVNKIANWFSSVVTVSRKRLTNNLKLIEWRLSKAAYILLARKQFLSLFPEAKIMSMISSFEKLFFCEISAAILWMS